MAYNNGLQEKLNRLEAKCNEDPGYIQRILKLTIEQKHELKLLFTKWEEDKRIQQERKQNQSFIRVPKVVNVLEQKHSFPKPPSTQGLSTVDHGVVISAHIEAKEVDSGAIKVFEESSMRTDNEFIKACDQALNGAQPTVRELIQLKEEPPTPKKTIVENGKPFRLCQKTDKAGNMISLIQLRFRRNYSVRLMCVNRNIELHDPYRFRLLVMSYCFDGLPKKLLSVANSYREEIISLMFDYMDYFVDLNDPYRFWLLLMGIKHHKVIEKGSELPTMTEKMQLVDGENVDGKLKMGENRSYEELNERFVKCEEELKNSNIKLLLAEEEIVRLNAEFKKCEYVSVLAESMAVQLESLQRDMKMRKSDLEFEKRKVIELQKQIVELEVHVSDSKPEALRLIGELVGSKEKIKISEGDIANFSFNVKISSAKISHSGLEGSKTSFKDIKMAVKMVLMLNPDDLEILAMVSIFFANENMWDEVASVKKLMKDSRKKKVFGYSVLVLLDMNGKLHVFLMGDINLASTMLNNNSDRLPFSCWYWLSYKAIINKHSLNLLLPESSLFDPWGQGSFEGWRNVITVREANDGDMFTEMLSWMFDCMEKLVYDVIVHDKIIKEINLYKDAAGDFGRKIAVGARDTLLLAEWWSTYEIGTLLSLMEVLPLFSNTNRGQTANLNFLYTHMVTSFEKRPTPWRAMIIPKGVHICDFLTRLKIYNYWGKVEIIENGVMGVFVARTVFCLKDDTDIRVKFNSKTAWECARNMLVREILFVQMTVLIQARRAFGNVWSNHLKIKTTTIIASVLLILTLTHGYLFNP